jgi:hypothetical protein
LKHIPAIRCNLFIACPKNGIVIPSAVEGRAIKRISAAIRARPNSFNHIFSKLCNFAALQLCHFSMKYTRLTKEQFDELHAEFINFLATQSIDKAEWDSIKKNQPQIAEQELDVFSDLIWEGVLSRAEYLEHFSKDYIFLFQCSDSFVHSIVLKALAPDVDFLTKPGLEWLSDNMFTDNVEMKVGKKPFTEERNASIFSLIQQGAFLSDGQLYKQIHNILES